MVHLNAMTLAAKLFHESLYETNEINGQFLRRFGRLGDRFDRIMIPMKQAIDLLRFRGMRSKYRGNQKRLELPNYSGITASCL